MESVDSLLAHALGSFENQENRDFLYKVPSSVRYAMRVTAGEPRHVLIHPVRAQPRDASTVWVVDSALSLEELVGHVSGALEKMSVQASQVFADQSIYVARIDAGSDVDMEKALSLVASEQKQYVPALDFRYDEEAFAAYFYNLSDWQMVRNVTKGRAIGENKPLWPLYDIDSLAESFERMATKEGFRAESEPIVSAVPISAVRVPNDGKHVYGRIHTMKNLFVKEFHF